MTFRIATLSSLVLACLAFPSSAADRFNRPDAASLDALINSGEPEKIAQALEGIDIWVKANAWTAGRQMRKFWLVPLMKQKRYAEVLALSTKAVLSAADDVDAVEHAQTMKVRALSALEKKEEALAEAKSLYNVATMKGTSAAISLLAECLAAARSDGPELARRFRLEQCPIFGSLDDPSQCRGVSGCDRPGDRAEVRKPDGVGQSAAAQRQAEGGQ
jgi:hypothetical protein